MTPNLMSSGLILGYRTRSSKRSRYGIFCDGECLSILPGSRRKGTTINSKHPMQIMLYNTAMMNWKSSQLSPSKNEDMCTAHKMFLNSESLSVRASESSQFSAAPSTLDLALTSYSSGMEIENPLF